jgi:phosphatidylserine/phosphatidylglycerophosphate/cardiolipin synthase-like enzyme
MALARVGRVARRLLGPSTPVPHEPVIADLAPTFRATAAPAIRSRAPWQRSALSLARHGILATAATVGLMSLVACHHATNRVESRIGGENVFPTAHEMIRGAHHKVHLEMYEIGTKHVDGKRGAVYARGYAEQQQIVDDLVYQASQQHEVEVVLDVDEDSRHNVNNQQMVQYLRANHVHVDEYPADAVELDHVKLLIVDGQRVLLGGENFSSESPANHDADLYFDDAAAAAEAEGIFHADQAFARGQRANCTLAPISGKHADIGFMTTTPHAHCGGASDIRNYLLDAIHRAHHEFFVEMYTLNNPAVIDALIEAKGRGVDVRIILDPSEETNKKSFALLKAGKVPVRWFVPQGKELLHAKWDEEDEEEVELGSANWTVQGLDGGGQRDDGSRPSKASDHNHEVAAHVKDKKVAADFRARFLDDWEHRTTDSDEPVRLPAPPHPHAHRRH